MAIAETERQARAGAEGALGWGTRQINDSVEQLCDVQRLWLDVGKRPATRRVGSGNRRAQAAPSRTHHLTTKKMEPGGQKAYHSVSARLAYLAADRLTLQSPARSAVGQSGEQRVQNTDVGSESDDTCCTRQEL